MRITIERLRTLVLGLGILLIVSLVAFLALGRWKNRLNLKEIPKRLGANIQRQANGFVYTQSHGGHTLFKIQAAEVVQLKNGGRAQLHDVKIELYGQDGTTVDRISGGEFQYDQKAGIATAAGPVEISIMRPNVAPAVAPGARPQLSPKSPLGNAAETAAAGQIDVKTSGLTFDQKTGVATTPKLVEFSVMQGAGSSLGATFDSGKGQLILDRNVAIEVRRGREIVTLRAAHAEFERNQLTCDLRGAWAGYRNGQATAGTARVLLREDGSAVRLDAHDGFTLTSATGAKILAPTGSLDFNEDNQPTQGRLEGGVTMQSNTNGRNVIGSAPMARIAFAPGGELRHAHLERGVTMHSDVQAEGGAHMVRDWRSAVAEMDFRDGSDGQLQMASVQGTGGVVISGQMQRPGGAVIPSRMSADQVTGQFGEHQELTSISGMGHASMEQTTAAGVRQTTSGDRLEAQLATTSGEAKSGQAKSGEGKPGEQIQSATIDGHVVLTEQQPAKTGAAAQAPLRATAGHAAYDGTSEWLHLTRSPRIEDAALQLTADTLDVSQASGDAYAHGNVKATWFGDSRSGDSGFGDSGAQGGKPSAAAGMTLGARGPAHVIAAEAQLHRSSNEAVFRGQVRLWQQANSISAPEIVLSQALQTLMAHGGGPGQPVHLVLLSAGAFQTPTQQKKPSNPSVIRVRAGDLKYSGAERKVLLHSGPAGPVIAETAAASTSSNEAEIVLLPPGNHAAPDGGSAEVDHLTARGHVVVTSNGRRGTGEQLVYSGENGQYVLTGTAAAPPRMTDPLRGSITGEALIFNSRDDSVSIEGQGQKTVTQTVAPK